MADENTPLLYEGSVAINASEDEKRSPSVTRSTFALCDPKRAAHRYMVLVFMCFLGFGSYFCYDNPAALQDQILSDMSVTTTEFSSLYSWYSWPNVVLCFFGGFLIDRVFGIRFGAIIYCFFILLGQFVFAAGAVLDKFWLMELGRFVFGLASSTCLLSLLCALILGYFDWRAEKILENLSNDTGEVIRIKDVKDFPLTFWLLSIICIAYYVAIFPFIALAT
ncbi:major facilitator superfamily domain-containing protein 1-like [Centruroides sculpturatus]|uniref:major facilitator superfamily domain-containing protein 1-like n=1 Tax=Centruroides sculpturatus TaxID=218467 RepID=UPI000C6EC3E1|nr:major facilitator superfamily domain-containing protein 1-like [Centruroides sculpturatus]